MVILTYSTFVFLNLIAFVTAQWPQFNCTLGIENFASGITYDTNLNTLLDSVSSQIGENGFYNASLGQIPDQANIIVLCRGDIKLDTCRRCINTTITNMLNLCPNTKQAVIYTELCMLRQSNKTIYGILENSPNTIVFIHENAMIPDHFLEYRRSLINDLLYPASQSGPMWKVWNADRNKVVFVFVQCTPDLTSDECYSCLNDIAGSLPSGCKNSTGCRFFKPSCNIGYDTQPYFNGTRTNEILGLSPPPAIDQLPPPAIDQSPPPGKKDDNTARTVIIVVVSVVLCLLLVICYCVLVRRRIYHKLKKDRKIDDHITMSECMQYDFGTIRTATNDFSDTNKLGEGGFGVVYKGLLEDGREIAVKRLSTNSGQGDLEFKNEVMLVGKLQHRNLVKLLGFSIEGNEKILIYEFIQNASLDLFIFDPIKRSYLDWDRRYKIIVGVARGLLYLHVDSRINIIHRDLKASNVLLDGEMNPKIADFGMARLFEVDKTQANTSRIVGTYGYMAPEYAMHGQFSVKSDVFSFGVLVLEIITGQKNNSFRNGETIRDLLCAAWECWSEGTSTNIIDPVIRAGSGNLRDILRCIHIGLLCVQENIASRPTMTSIVLMFNSLSMSLPVPSEPAFFTQVNNSKDFESKSVKANKSPQSSNDVSVSNLFPR